MAGITTRPAFGEAAGLRLGAPKPGAPAWRGLAALATPGTLPSKRRFGFGLGVALGLSSFIVVACTGDNESSSVLPETACNDAAEALCGKIQECASFALTAAFADRAQCITRYKINCTSTFSANGTSATPSRLSQCAADLRGATCENVMGRTPPESCRTLPGTLTDGSPCGHNEQCAGKLCRVPRGNTCGACSTLGAAGAACDRDEDCDYGLSCHRRACVVLGKAGATCSPTQPCAATLGCVNRVCATALTAGATCDFRADENPCDAGRGYYCHPRNRVCTPFGTSPPGGQCEFSVERITTCTSGASCEISPGSTTGGCEAVAADGAPCDTENGPKCLAPARCRNGVCTIVDPTTCK